MDSDCDILPYPAPEIRRKKRDNKRVSKKFFVLTSDEAYYSKLNDKTKKLEKERQKNEKQRILKEKKENIGKKMKIMHKKNSNSRKTQRSHAPKVNTTKPKKRQNEENWQCIKCDRFYFDAENPKYNDDWVQCIECAKVRCHITCASDCGKFDNDDIDGDFTCKSCFK